jgi:transposase
MLADRPDPIWGWKRGEMVAQDPKDLEIRRLLGRNQCLEREVAALKHENARLRDQLAEQNGKLAHLAGKLAMNSGNSSLPPSSDFGPTIKRRPPEPPSGKPQGAQAGHAGKTREAIPLAQVDHRVDLDPEVCAHCRTKLEGADRIDAETLQTVELPDAPPVVTATCLWKKRCPKCGGFTRAKRPKGLPKGVFGPRIQAVVSLLSGAYRISRREISNLCRDVFGFEISVGSVQACCERTSAAMAPAFEAICGDVKSAKAVFADETGWPYGSHNKWLWVAASEEAECFMIQAGRGRINAMALLGDDYAGALHHDRAKAYDSMASAQHQVCWAHLLRDFQAMLETVGETGVQGAMLKLAADRIFALWRDFGEGQISRRELRVGAGPIQREIRQRLAHVAASKRCTSRARGTARDLLGRWNSLWLFLKAEGVEPTNNRAERALRRAVLWKKGSFGSRSESGCRFVERILSITGTGKLRGVPILQWLTEAVRSARSGTPALLPACPG